MTLNNWEIWHNRTSAFQAPRLDLGEAAARLVRSGACVLAHHSEGTVWYWKEDEVRSGSIGLNHRPYDRQASVSMPQFEGEFETNCACLSAEMTFIERTTFSDKALQKATYVRCFFEPILVGEQDRHTSFYPSVKIYANGICTFSLRIFSPEWPTDSQRVLAEDIALGQRYFESLLISPSLMEAAPKIDILHEIHATDPSILSSVTPEELAKRLYGELVRVPEGESERLYCNIDAKKIGGYAALEFVWAILEGTVDAIALRPPSLHPKAIVASRGYDRDWVGHPTVFILKWPGQPFSAEKMGAAEKSLACIMARSASVPSSAIPSLLQPMPRIFDDYKAYVNEALSLYAFGRQSLERADQADTHFQRVSLPMQVNEEMALWLIGSYRHLEKVSLRSLKIEEVRQSELEKRSLDAVVQRLSRYGELDEFFGAYLKRFRISQVSNRIDAELAASETDHKDRVNTRLARFGVVLAVLFGLIGSGQIADSVVSPLRKAGVWLPRLVPFADQKLSDYVLSIFVIMLVAIVFLAMARRLEKS